MRISLYRSVNAALALSLAVTLSACSVNAPENRMLNSVHQPVVERDRYVFDVETLPGGGLSISEQRRLTGWFEGLGLKYGDKIAIDDPLQSKATLASVDGVAGRWGMFVDGPAPVTPGYVAAGGARIVVTRAKASVPGCPDWTAKSDFSMSNRTTTNFGCAINSNLAAMVADKEHLVQGASGTGETVVMSGNKAIDSFRNAKPSGENGLKASTTSNSGGGN
ncbi:MAG: pilus assembly protein CpaD [Novosphingobium sp. 28-62-57]|uniref:CpaD family pilus assembly protein n=1 Tax=unclassified Novosphingobium TaxID=2644732 RepID=UPI000BD7A993|nr:MULTISPECIES: CpaD family pilus assembly protein [unclassified Novosphingobium]OYW50789.1 MAG: pilus assembly protein CpaD [Novosphingobium sp. 12-62-10]OYZ10073.1 MAG: pilus assembly protein CpaD [Novosphingobium sp. 28-62-57]OZA32747.1 MAG: pilus assembly protein CpaD [Novosphingobium sp. 17-62-9]HQS70472.1 CpaD family pilus assembly protein [Novosphingobium sp.]